MFAVELTFSKAKYVGQYTFQDNALPEQQSLGGK